MRVLYLSEVQWLSQVSRKHQMVRRFPDDWSVLFLSPINTARGENSFRTRSDAEHPGVSYASLPLPKPDSKLALVRALTGALSAVGLRYVLNRARAFHPDVVVCSYIWASPVAPSLKEMGIPVVYDCNDLHTEFYPARREEAERRFASLVAEATEVVCSSSRLQEICGRGVVIGNGVDLETFGGRTGGALPAPIAESDLRDCEDFVAYVGSVDDRIDFGILEYLAGALEEREPATGLVCVGRVFGEAGRKAAELSARHPDRVLFTGRARYSELPSYLSSASVGIAPFVLDERTRAINPNKLYMYAAMDENVVSTPFSEDVTAHSDHIYVESDPDAYARAVLSALEDDERRSVIRERIALPNDWNAKAREFSSLLLKLAGR